MVAEEPFFFDVKKIHSDTETLLGSHFAHLLEAAIPHADPRTGSISADNGPAPATSWLRVSQSNRSNVKWLPFQR